MAPKLYFLAILATCGILSACGSPRMSGRKENSINWRFADMLAIKTVTDSDLLSDQSIADWKPPSDFPSRFPYFISGYDDDSRPIWIIPSGTWNVQKVVEAGGAEIEAFEMYIRQAAFNLLSSIQTSEIDGEPMQWVLILDYDKLKMSQLTSLPTVQFATKLQKEYQALADLHTGQMFIVNANYAAEALIELTRSVASDLQDRLEVFGINRAKWVPELVQKLPSNQLPQKYGGHEGYTPVKVFG